MFEADIRLFMQRFFFLEAQLFQMRSFGVRVYYGEGGMKVWASAFFGFVFQEGGGAKGRNLMTKQYYLMFHRLIKSDSHKQHHKSNLPERSTVVSG